MFVDEYLSSLEKFGINLGLGRIKFLLNKLSNPHLKFKSIHVAGTNGKGSTCAMLASILKEAGYKVGLFTSPHLFDYRERIKVDGREISPREFQQGLAGIRREEQGGAGKPTVFEVLTAVAFWYFAKRKVDYAVVEVGMGGRLDATNVITPLVSVITNIDYEHTAVLGKTLAKIAFEKAGIIKPGVPVVTAERKAEALKVIKRVAERERAGLKIIGRKQNVERRKQNVERRTLNVGELKGAHQQLNAACALAALCAAGIKVSDGAIAAGLRKVRWPARFQIVSKKPLTIVDGAHNPAGIKTLMVTIQEMFPKIKFAVIFGCQKDKDYPKMLERLKPIAKKVIIAYSSHQDAARFEQARSLKQAIAAWDKRSPLLITGSLFLAADAISALTPPARIL